MTLYNTLYRHLGQRFSGVPSEFTALDALGVL
jgi:hypothetical protein